MNYFKENHTLVIEKRSGEFENLIREREIKILFMDKSLEKSFSRNHQQTKIKYKGALQAVTKI
jgi:hypothetical protein